MSWRTIVISKKSKLELQLNYVVVRQADIKTKIFIEDIAILIIESTAVSITAALLDQLMKNKIKVIFCDEKRNPSSELVSYYGSYNSSDRIVQQMKWKDSTKNEVWKCIVKDKILKQAGVLQKNNLEECEMLVEYSKHIEDEDRSNREGHAAKVYFNALFGNDFSRGRDSPINDCLNFGYSLILSAFNREISINGYLTQLGIFHKGKTNPFNLASDLMEPWRPLIDAYVKENNPREFDQEVKYDLIGVLNSRVEIDGKRYTVLDAIKIYCKSVFDALNNDDVSLIKEYRSGG